MTPAEDARLLLQIVDRYLVVRRVNLDPAFPDEEWGFLARQALEKLLKAAIVLQDERPPFTHELRPLARLEGIRKNLQQRIDRGESASAAHAQVGDGQGNRTRRSADDPAEALEAALKQLELSTRRADRLWTRPWLRCVLRCSHSHERAATPATSSGQKTSAWCRMGWSTGDEFLVPGRSQTCIS